MLTGDLTGGGDTGILEVILLLENSNNLIIEKTFVSFYKAGFKKQCSDQHKSATEH